MADTHAGITHVWPYNKFNNPDAQPFSSERECDIWDELRSLTFDEDVRGNIAVATHERDIVRHDGKFSNNHEIARTEITEKFQEEEVVNNRLGFFEPREVEWEIHRPATAEFTLKSRALSQTEYTSTTIPAKDAHVETKKERLPFHLGSKQDAEFVIKQHQNHEICALVLWHPEFNPYGSEYYLKHLQMVHARCPELPIYIFHWDFRDDKWGVEREGGSGSWQNHFHSKTEALTIPSATYMSGSSGVTRICTSGLWICCSWASSLWCLVSMNI